MTRLKPIIFSSLFVLIAPACSLQKWDKLNEGSAGSTSDSGGAGGDSETGGTGTKGSVSAKGGSSSKTSKTAQGGSTVDETSQPTGGIGGGAASTGGATSSGGSTASTTSTTRPTTGGASATGGSSATGGTKSSGGTTSQGGAVSTGGSIATGGTTSVSCDPAKPFGSLTQVVPSSGASSEVGLSASSDGLTAVVAVRTDNATNYDLYAYSRTSTTVPFSNPTPIAGSTEINTTSNEVNPRLSRDGLTLFFAKWSVNSQIYRSVRATKASNFPTPSVLPAAINGASSANDDPWISPDGTEFYWTANARIFRADVATGFVVSNANAVAELNVVSAASTPVLTFDQLTVYLSSTHVSGSSAKTNHRIWKSTRSSKIATWTTPTLVSELSDASSTYPSDVSGDGCILYVKKLASGTTYHLYQAVKPL